MDGRVDENADTFLRTPFVRVVPSHMGFFDIAAATKRGLNNYQAQRADFQRTKADYALDQLKRWCRENGG